MATTDLRIRLAEAVMDAVGADEQDAYQVVDVLLSLPGIASVTLPEPDGAVWRINEDFEVSPMRLEALSAVRTRHSGCQITWGSLELNLVNHEARALAAALLAAANAAEQQVAP